MGRTEQFELPMSFIQCIYLTHHFMIGHHNLRSIANFQHDIIEVN